MIRYGSVCSGVEAASLAWHPLGWQCQFVAEIDKFPAAVLRERFPEMPNLGDMTRIKIEENDDTATSPICRANGPIDLLVGGTPCQSYSVAGKREGNRGVSGLSLDYIRLAYESHARWVVWENVPGVFSSTGGLDFAAFLSGLCGWEVTVPRGGWKNAGICANAPGCYGVAWRVLDAQYTRVPGFPRAIPQRRRRVFLVGYRGQPVGCPLDWQRAAEVLFDGESLSGDPPSRGKARKGTAGDAEGCAGTPGITNR